MQIKRFIYIILVVAVLGGIFLIYGIYENYASSARVQNSAGSDRTYIGQVKIPEERMFRVGIIGTASDASSSRVYATVRQLCESLHFTIVEPEIASLGAQPTQSFAGPSADLDVLIICDSHIGRYNSGHALEAFVAQGGHVIFAAGISDEDADRDLYPMLGIQSVGETRNYHTLVFEDALLPVQPSQAHYAESSDSRRIAVTDEVSVYLQSQEDAVPLLHVNDWQEGRACLINGGFLEDIRYAGLLTGCIGAMLSDFIYPVLGVKAVFIDDFPMHTASYDELCKRAYGYSANGFVEEVIWPAFQGISLRTNTPYTTSVRVMASSAEDMRGVDEELLSNIDKWVLKFNGELAWGSDCLEAGDVVLDQTLIAQFTELFPQYTIKSLTLGTDAYAPQMLDIPKAEIKTVRGVLGDEKLQFVHDGEICVFPAATRGNVMEDGNLLAICSVIGAYGMVSHVFDADTLITEDGVSPAWDADKSQIGLFESDVLSKAPWLEGRTLSQTSDDVKSYLNLDCGWERQGNQISLDCGAAVVGQAFFYRCEKRIASAQGLTYQDAGNGYYLLRMQDSHGVITLEEG